MNEDLILWREGEANGATLLWSGCCSL